jgi:hypothetical protein
LTTKTITRTGDPGPLITYTVFPDVWPKAKTEHADAPWVELVRTLANPPAYMSKAACPLLSLCEYGDNLSDKGYLRHAGNVVRVHGVEVDYDGEMVTPEEGQARLQAAGLTAVIYTSASYTEGAPRWRAILPLSEAALPAQRATFVARANRALGGIASRESFTLSQSFYFGQVRGARYKFLETHGRCVDQAVDLEPLFHQAQGTDPKTGRDTRSNQQLLEAFNRGEGRYEAMLKLSSRWAARGMPYDDIVAALDDLLANGTSLNGDGIDLRTRIEPMAASAVRKFGGTVPDVRLTAPEPPADLPDMPPPEAWQDTPEAHGMTRSHEPDVASVTPGVTTATPGRRLILRAIGEIVAERREATWLIHNVLEANVLAVLAGPRASFKSFIALDWAMRIAAAGNPVVILSGEGAGLGRRAEAWVQEHGNGRTLDELRLLALESVANLNAEADMGSLQEGIDEAGIRPALIIVDTFSKFSAGLDENSNQEVAEYLSKLTVGLRERYSATVLLVAHSGHGDSKRPRGASALMANPDAEYIVERPDVQAMVVNVTRERFKDTASMAPVAYEAIEVDLGRADKYGERVKSLVMRETAAAGRKEREAMPQGKAQRQLLTALRERQRGSDSEMIWSLPDLRQIGREAAMSKTTAHAAAEALAFSPFMTGTVGGYKLSREGK